MPSMTPSFSRPPSFRRALASCWPVGPNPPRPRHADSFELPGTQASGLWSSVILARGAGLTNRSPTCWMHPSARGQRRIGAVRLHVAPRHARTPVRRSRPFSRLVSCFSPHLHSRSRSTHILACCAYSWLVTAWRLAASGGCRIPIHRRRAYHKVVRRSPHRMSGHAWPAAGRTWWR